MAQICYVKNGGVRATTTPYSARQAISSATMTTANYYDSIADVHLYNTLDPLDEVLCFNEHDKEYDSAHRLIDFKTGVKYLSVDETNGSLYKAGAHESTPITYDLTLDSINSSDVHLEGISFSGGRNLFYGHGYNCDWVIKDCKLAIIDTLAGRTIATIQGQNTVLLKDIEVEFNNVGQFMKFSSGAIVYMDNVTPLTNVNKLIAQSSVSTLQIVEVKNSDWSILTGIIVDFYAASADSMKFSFERIKINSAADLTADPVTFCGGQTLDFWSISKSTDDDSYHYFEHYRYEGKVLESIDAGTRSDGATYDGVNHFSTEFQTSDNVVAYTQPLRYKLAELELDLTTSKQLTFHIMMQDGTTPTALNDHECWIEVVYPDATDNALGQTVSSQTHDILETPVDLALSNKSWDNTTGELTKQLMSVTVPASIAKAPVTVYLHLAKDVTAIGATEFFACPKPEIS